MTTVSVIIPVYNGAATIARAIDSALAQDFDGFEIIVVNDGSTDGTARILEGYGAKIHVVNQPNRGAGAARNSGIRAARGAYLAFLDADDVWLGGKLEKTVAVLDASPGAVLAFSGYVAVNETGQKIEAPLQATKPLSLQEMLAKPGWDIYTSTVVARRSAVIDSACFSSEFQGCGFEDTYAWLLLREHGPFVYVPAPLVLYRAPAFWEFADKYGTNLRLYSSLLRRRYGLAANPVVKATNEIFVNSLVAKAFWQMERGQNTAALRTWMRVMRARPSYFLKLDNLGRLARPRNLRRIAAFFFGRTEATRPHGF